MEIICTPSVNSCHLKIVPEHPSYFDEPGTGYIEIKVYAVSPLNQEINFQFESAKAWRYPLNLYVFPLYSNSTYFVEAKLLSIELDGTRHIAVETSNAFITKRKHTDGAFDEFSDELDRIDKDINANYVFKDLTEQRNATRESAVAIIAFLDCYCGLNPSRRIVPKRFNPDDNEQLPSGIYKYGLINTITCTGYYDEINLLRGEQFIDARYSYWRGAHIGVNKYYWQYLAETENSALPDPMPEDYYVDQSTGFFPFIPRMSTRVPAIGFCRDYGYFLYPNISGIWNDNTGTIEYEWNKAFYVIFQFLGREFFNSRNNPKELVKKLYEQHPAYQAKLIDYNYLSCMQKKACYWYQRLAKKPCKRGMPLWEYLRYTV